MPDTPRQEFGSFRDVHAVGVRKRGGRLTAGPVFCPVYLTKETAHLPAGQQDVVLIDDEAYTADTDTEAAKIALLRRVDTELSDLIWKRTVAVVTLQGILSRKGKVGIFDVLFVAGPTFDMGRRADDRAVAQRAARGEPTGLPGDRKLIVPVPKGGIPGRRFL